jgi:LysR family transcriptional regulator, nitrogen assimilation regulatory protein
MMDLKQLKYFLCLAHEGNVTRAARQLNIVQPALSMQIAKLEKSIGRQLFFRSAHGVSLTPAGETLTGLAASILQNVDHAQEEMARLDGKISGRVSIGMITSAAQSTLAASTAKIAARYPDIRLLVCEGYTETLIEWVTTGQLDVAIVNVPPGKHNLVAHHILDEEMMLARGAENKAALTSPMSYRQLKDLDLVLPSRRHGLRRILDTAAAAARITLEPRLEIDTLSAVCEVVATTNLTTVLPGVALYPDLANGRIKAHRLRKPSIVRTVAWLTHPRRAVSAATAAVMEVLAEDLQNAAQSASRLVKR